jgi:1,4-alpha-glucan branching enzyme
LAVIYVHNADRVIAFHRWKGPEHYLVVATFSDTPWTEGYRIPTPSLSGGHWREIFTSDAIGFGGAGIGNSEELPVVEEQIEVKLPARGFIVIRYVPES